MRNALTGNTALIEVDSSTRLQEILDSAVEFWSMAREPYLLRLGRRLIPASKTVGEADIGDGDTIEILPDPEGG
ncbi:MAG: hypothetical protein KIY12_10430 [Thermoplasmata archaeon]|uniref:Ubiquitin-like domain-containing protein n=1 Tax=Candidatus Sysuiplasma superficiale TaxID=2823368 RepID=A0A8J8CIW6_9ARCH|nr:hypothetical protein [Candidatus Sysuiplasma superficiale]MBX8645113.1 hypothetical protein [Candidatus Sysuiplasma superficiale]MCL4347005.1 small ubiquitin-related modifier domain-containing protein [Candidatus Thermoplasmatota archaeon]